MCRLAHRAEDCGHTPTPLAKTAQSRRSSGVFLRRDRAMAHRASPTSTALEAPGGARGWDAPNRNRDCHKGTRASGELS